MCTRMRCCVCLQVDGDCAVHVAARGRAWALREMLAWWPDLSRFTTGSDKLAPIHCAARCTASGALDCIRALVEVDADSLELGDQLHLTALHHAADCRNGAVVRLLLELGANKEARAAGNGVRSPLHFAALAGAVECASLLIAAGADVHARDAVRDA